MQRITYILAFYILVWNLSFSQQDQENIDKIFEDAEYFFNSGDYPESLFLFLKLTLLEPDNANFNYRTGMTYLNIPGQETKAIPHLEKAVINTSMKYRSKDLAEKNAPHYAWFYLGNAYRINNDLDKALECYSSFKNIKDFEKNYNIRIVDSEIKVCERAKIIKDSPKNIVKNNIGAPVNSINSDYSPVLTHNENIIVFMNSQTFYEAIMYSKKINGVWSIPVNITPQIGSDGDMIPTCLSADGTDLYLVKKDENNSDIYLSHFDGNLWSPAIRLNKNINSRSNETFASLSSDNKILYFTSNRSESLGGQDIFISKKQSIGDWGPAVNLGPIINTELDEDSPYLSEDGKTLFFSSKGHFNMGGFDIFYAILNKKNQFDEAINIGFPINTTNDNLNYFPIKDGKTAYIALFDDNSLGGEDIYKLEILPNTTPQQSIAPSFNRPFTITITDIESSEKIDLFYDNKTNQFKIKSSNGKTYKVSFNDN